MCVYSIVPSAELAFVAICCGVVCIMVVVFGATLTIESIAFISIATEMVSLGLSFLLGRRPLMHSLAQFGNEILNGIEIVAVQ